jgi:hypothetical protein
MIVVQSRARPVAVANPCHLCHDLFFRKNSYIWRREMMMDSLKLAALFSTVAIIGCGGGDPDSSYVTIFGNANQESIADANNEFFRIRSSDRAVVNQAGTVLNGLQVDSASRVFLNSQLIGRVELDLATNGTQIAVFRCENAASMDIIVAAGGYSVQGCVSASSPSPSPSPSPAPAPSPPSSSADGINASSCLSTSRAANGQLILSNACNQTVYFSFCLLGSSTSSFACGPSSTSGGVITYGRGNWQVSSGGTYTFPDGSNASGAILFGCAAGPSGIQPLPNLTQLNPPTGFCR